MGRRAEGCKLDEKIMFLKDERTGDSEELYRLFRKTMRDVVREIAESVLKDRKYTENKSFEIKNKVPN